MQEKFIDLCVDDNHSAYGQMPNKQETFKTHLEKLSFTFETKCLDLPAGMVEDEGTMDKHSIESLQTADTDMGKDLDAIFDLMNGKAVDQFKHEQVVIEHQWNDKAKKFDELEH